jgi:hypothetical protein
MDIQKHLDNYLGKKTRYTEKETPHGVKQLLNG